MHKRKVHFMPDDISIMAESGTTISQALSLAGIKLTQPCGGLGTCGHCIVFSAGTPLKACITSIDADMVIHVPSSIRLSDQEVLSDTRLYNSKKNVLPLIEQIYIELPRPTLDDPVSDVSRVMRALSEKLNKDISLIQIESDCIPELSCILRENSFNITVNICYLDERIIILSLTDAPIYGLAIDIGTTTVAIALCDLKTGIVLDNIGISNPQAEHGSDVISRIVFTEDTPNGSHIMQQLIVNGINESIHKLLNRTQISKDSLLYTVIAANTVMCHFLLGLPTEFLRREPYVPCASEYPYLRAKDLGLPILPNGFVQILPSIASYVGGDITAGLIATEISKENGINLFIDIGTNGEMVLSGAGFMIACSCSAGPAFEGSGITCGSRAVKGAIDSVEYSANDNKFIYDVIGGNASLPTSICGSGLISLLSALLKAGIIDRSGRFTETIENYSVTENISINETDIQNLIRAKAAIFAGLEMLLKHLDLSVNDLNQIIIAGGFGRSLNIEKAVNIGMLPHLKNGSYSFVGNASLSGALKVLNDRTVNTVDIAKSVTNLELSIGNDFMEEFVQACFLPHTDFSLFN